MRREPRRDFGQAADQLGTIADRLSKRALDVTTPVYATSGNGKPRHQGSAVLLRLGEIRFLISAGHVLETIREQELSASACGVISPITGEVTYVCGSDTECPDGDPVDIRVVRLAGPEWDSVPLSRFLHWDELDHDPPVPKRHAFALIGFPHTKQRGTLKGTHITSQAYRILGMECPASAYAGVDVDPEINLLVGFEKRRTWGPKGMLTAPDLYGASGCGLWRFGRHIRDAVNPPRLAAIGVRWEARGRVKHIAGTRIQLVLSGIADRYADARITIDRHSKAFPWHPLQVSPMGTARTK